MGLKILEQFHDAELCRGVLDRLRQELDGELRFMEVCGTHTVSIFQSGLRSLLPEGIVHLSGPGCPVCVTHESEVNAFIELAGRDRVIIATFGDLMRVPGNRGRSLKLAQAEGGRVKVLYSPFEALALARQNPNHTVVFLGVGFETTAPAVAATVKMAEDQNLDNFRVLALHKTVPPALGALLDDPGCNIDAFILPGHVSTIIGTAPYGFIAERYGKQGVVAGFEPLDILRALLFIARRRRQGRPEVANLYRRVVADQGNPRALEIMYEVFEPADALWRGLGLIPGSGLAFRQRYARFDAGREFGVKVQETPPLPGCRCGEVLKGKLNPNQCPLFEKACTPAKPVGPCMVSTEGSCAAYYKYQVG
ncbi:MAG: hydrogenase formation protein HypD [Desulfovibrionaceae bacterium]|nr:hydrogenase formation protein HypD [Desulfovibrionaceae bacterium]